MFQSAETLLEEALFLGRLSFGRDCFGETLYRDTGNDCASGVLSDVLDDFTGQISGLGQV